MADADYVVKTLRRALRAGHAVVLAIDAPDGAEVVFDVDDLPLALDLVERAHEALADGGGPTREGLH